jgi:alpha-galactosidase
METKISIIGAGSGAFSLALIRDICLTPNLEGSTVSFMDIDPERLEAAYTLCRRYAQELSFELYLEKTLDRRESLQGADFVINTALAAGHHRLREGWEIARRYGYNWGGSFHVMYDEAFWINFYQFRLFESAIEDVLEICPQAWHLLVANPVLADITHLTRKYPNAKIVGLCHGFSGVYGVAEALGLDREHLTFEIPGVNHFVWLTHCYYKGEDIFPMLDRWIEEEVPKYRKEGKAPPGLSLKAIDLYKRFGAVPIGDTAGWSGASWPVWYHSDEATEKRWGEEPVAGWDGYFTYVAQNAAELKRVAGDDSIKVTDYFPPQVSGEPMVPIIESITCDIPRVVIGNIQNSGDFVPGVPRDFEVEIPTLVSKRGIQGIQTQGLPKPLLAHILRDRVAPVNLELEAYARGSRELLLQLILMDPWSRSEEQARGLLEEILALPYHVEMCQHYQ